jgi:hypothetical protein
MKLTILRLNTANKPSPMSEGVMEIQINNQPCKGINLTTQHTWAMEATRVTTIHDVVKVSGQVLPRPSAVFHMYASADTPWVARTLSHMGHTKLLSLGIPYIPYVSVHSSAYSSGLNQRGP